MQFGIEEGSVEGGWIKKTESSSICKIVPKCRAPRHEIMMRRLRPLPGQTQARFL